MDPKNLPAFNLSSDQLPALKDWEVGVKYELVITVEMTGQRKAESYDIPDQDLSSEGTQIKRDVMIGSFQIKEVETEADEEAEEGEDGSDVEDEMDPMGNDPANYEAEYAIKRAGANINISVTTQKK